MLVLLFLIVLLAIAGLLGAVLKAFAVLVIVAVLMVATIALAGYLAIRHQLRKDERAIEPRTTRIQVGEPRPSDLPPSDRDDRY